MTRNGMRREPRAPWNSQVRAENSPAPRRAAPAGPPEEPTRVAATLLALLITVLVALGVTAPPLMANAEDPAPAEVAATATASAAAAQADGKATVPDETLEASPVQAQSSEPTSTTDPQPTESSAETSGPPQATGSADTGDPSPYPTPAASEPSTTPTPSPAPAPTIRTDHEDYPPGATVRLFGAAWAAGEPVEIHIVATDGSIWDLTLTTSADTEGRFIESFVLPDELIATYDVTATGPVSGVATTTFTDAAGAYSLKWYASDPEVNKAPYLPTYNKIQPSAALPYPVGRATDPLRNAVAFGPTASTLDAVTSLAPKAMALGQVVPFQMDIRVSGSNAPENGTITFQSAWGARTSSGSDFGFDPTTHGLIAAFVDAGDVGTVDPLANARVSSFSWARVDPTTNNDRTVGTVTVTGLDDGDRIVVELWVVLKSTIAQGISGNVATTLVSANTGPAAGGGSAINTGAQTVPLLRVQDFFSSSADVSVTKSDGPDPVLGGQQLTYSVVATNNSTDTVANQVVVTDTLDPNTSFVSGGWPGGSCTASGSTVTCPLGALSPLQAVTVTIVTTVATAAPHTNDTSTVAKTGTCTAAGPGIDLCNRVTLSLIGTDPNLANNSASQPTNVVTGAVTLTKVTGYGALLPGAQFRLYVGTPASPFNPASPGTPYGANLVYTTDANGRLTVENLPSGPYYFVEVLAPAGFMLNPNPVTFTVSVASFVRVEQVTRTNWITPSITKGVTASGQTAESASYGENLTWVLQPRVPGNISSYQYYRVEDVLDLKLTYTGNVQVRIAGTQLVQGTHYTVSAPTGTAGGTLTITFVTTAFGAFATTDLINATVITFTARINDQAIMGQPIANTARVLYHDGIASPGTATSGTATAVTGGKVFRKVAETAGGSPLPGAQFKVSYDSTGTQFVKDAQGQDVLLTSGADGLFWIKGLKFDLVNGTTYFLVETRAPVDGQTPYNLLPSAVPFTVTATSFYSSAATVTTTSTPPNAAPDAVINKTGFQIPQTGGPGTLLFTVIGLALMGGALAVRRK